MTPLHSKVAAVMVLSLTLLAQLTNSAHGNPTAVEQLERVIREAEEESKQLAKDIDSWMNEQPLDKEDHVRVLKSTEVNDNGEEKAETRGKFDGSDFTKIRSRRDAHQLQRKYSGQVTTKRKLNPVLQAFDLMQLLISEREKSLKKSKANNAGGKMIGRGAKQGQAAKREKPHKEKQKKNYSSRGATTGSKKFKFTSARKRASHSHLKPKVGKGKTRSVAQILKAMPRNQLQNLLKEKGLGKLWNVVKVHPKKSVKRKFHGKNGKTIKRTRGTIKGRKGSKRKKSKVTRHEKRERIHKKKSKLSFRKAALKSKKSKTSATNAKLQFLRNEKKRSKILRPPSKVHNFQGKKKHSRKSKAVHANHKFGVLKDKIKRTNELKFEVAKALLAHCATENKLRSIFRDVNMSLKKAAVLVEIIGRKMGMEKSDVQKITKQHPEKAVQQFLSEVF